jgi:hypothetical protein
MKTEAFLPSNSLGPGSASAVPATPADGGGVAGTRHPAPKVLSSAEYDKWAGEYLRNNRNAPRAYRLELINWRHQYQLQLEAAELKANPAAAADLRLVAERLARKAQSGFSGPPATDAPKSKM